MYRIFLFVALIATLTVTKTQVLAIDNVVTVPTFPQCTAPQGVVKVSYPSGTHGIAGSTQTYTGSDTVYTLSEDAITQCFCPPEGSGIQSNWWKVSSLTLDEIENLTNQGWIYIPNGAEWGLTEDPYLVKNSSFVCKDGGDDDNDDDDDDDDNDDDGDDDDDDDGQRIGGIGGPFGGQVLGASTLGLAATGNLPEIAALLAMSTGLFTFATLKFKKSRK